MADVTVMEVDIIQLGALMKFAGCIALYTRMHGAEELLASKMRADLLELIRAKPGISVVQASQSLGVNRTTVDYHARGLAKNHLIKRSQAGGKNLLYPPVRDESAAAWAWEDPQYGRVLKAVADQGGHAERSHLRHALDDVPERTRNYQIRRLLDLGILHTDHTNRVLHLPSEPASSAT